MGGVMKRKRNRESKQIQIKATADRGSFSARAWDGEEHTNELGSLEGTRELTLSVAGFKTTPELRSFATIEMQTFGVKDDRRINTATLYVDLEEARKLREALGQVIKFAAKGVVD